MRVAFVYDRVNKWGGAERVLLALHELWPEAPLFTAVYHSGNASWSRVFGSIIPSFLDHFPFARSHHEWFPWATPLAFETFSFDAFDVVISVTSAEAKNIITKPSTLHICYCLTPTRYLWSGNETYVQSSKMLRWMTPTLRRWDMVGSSRPDVYIAISKRVAARIKHYYQRDVAAIIYPPVDVNQFSIFNFQFSKKDKKDYFLVVSRLVPYKRIDLVIEAFNALGWRLVIIGDGVERSKLQQIAGPTIEFITHHLTDKELVDYYQHCRAFIFAADEDFGIAAVEAAACGKPVITFSGSGVAESVREGTTGLLFHQQSPASLVDALKRYRTQVFDPDDARQQALKFDIIRFQKRFKHIVEDLYKLYTI